MTLWTPANLVVGSKLWLQADSLALSNGASVTTWADSSGNAADATKPAALTAPTFQTNQLNSLPIVRYLQGDALAASHAATTVHSVFCVARYTNSAPATSFRVISGENAVANWLLGWWGDGGSGRTDTYWFAGGNLAGPTNSSWHMYDATSDATTTLVYSDGALLATNVGGAVGGLGGRLMMANASTTALLEGSDCEVAEVVICNYVVSTTARQLMEGYLAWKWGRQASLVAGHPYSSAAPTLDPPGPHPQTVPFTRGAGGGGKL